MLRKKPLGFETIDLRQLEMVCRMGNPFEAFSMMALRGILLAISAFLGECIVLLWKSLLTYLSMIVISGHVSAPADAALATSTPSRSPRSFVFHVGAAFWAKGDVTGILGAPGCSETVVMLRLSCAIGASRVILMRQSGRKDYRDSIICFKKSKIQATCTLRQGVILTKLLTPGLCNCQIE